MEEYWDRFVASGKIEDYLYYKGMRICEETMNRYKEGDTICLLYTSDAADE